MKIQNVAELATNKERQDVLAILEAGLQAIDTKKIVATEVKREENFLTITGQKFDLDKVGKILVIGVGKCSSEAAAELENILGNRITDGFVIDVSISKPLKRIKSVVGDHPFPSQKNVEATTKIIELLRGLSELDLVIFIISGGGSTFLCQPQNFTYGEEAEFIKCLMKQGVVIQDLNILRKHLSLARGGFLAKYTYPATAVALIFSDVPGNDIQAISSGPTVLDKTTIEDAKNVLAKFNAHNICNFDPERLIETPKEEKYFEKIKNTIVVSNDTALQAMAHCAEELGYHANLVTSTLSGLARDVGEKLAQEIGAASGKTVNIYGGETTVEVKGDGRGGRNQELVLAAGRKLIPQTAIASLASDGVDNTPVAGAIADSVMLEKAKKSNIDPENNLARNDSYTFFQVLGDSIRTGYTGSNISDIIVTLKL